MTHTPHPDILEAGLASGCPRCEQLASNPWLLDESNIARIASGHTYSDNDRIAQMNLRETLARADLIRGLVS